MIQVSEPLNGYRRSSRLSGHPNLAILAIMVATTLPHGVIERIVEVLDPEEVWLFGIRAR